MFDARREQKLRVQALERIPFLSRCTTAELERIDRLGTPLTVRPGRTLIREGAIGRECFVTLDGLAVAACSGRTVGEIPAGSIAGEIALLDRTTRTATVVADTPMELLVLDSREFSELLEIAPAIADDLTRLAAARLAALETCRV
jgi:voltage-gated potassium channel